MRQIARDEDGVTELGNFVKFSVCFVAVKGNVRERSGDDHQAVVNEGIEDGADFPEVKPSLG